MRLLHFSLREEARISGEAASFQLLESILGDLGINIERPLEEDSTASAAVGAVRRFARLREVAGANAIDILLVKIPTAAQLPAACYAARRFRGRLIFWIDGLLWRPRITAAQWRKFLLAEPLLTGARAFMNNALWTRLVRSRPLEIVVSAQVQREEIKALLSNAQVHVIPNGTLGQTAISAPRPDRPLMAGYIGHAYLVKGVWEILEAIRLLNSRRIEMPFRCALSGLGSARFRHAAAAEMEVLGEVDRPAFFASIDLLVAPYWVAWGTQTFPNVLLEAMQYGVPVLTTELPMCRELFPDGLAHFVPPHDAAALATVLGDLACGKITLPSPDRLRAHFAAHYSRSHIAAGWRDLLAGNTHAMLRTAHD